MISLNRREAQILTGNWIEGLKNGFEYSIKTYDSPSDYGINCGKISKLDIRKNGEILAGYDRGWYIEPKKEARVIYEELIMKYN